MIKKLSILFIAFFICSSAFASFPIASVLDDFNRANEDPLSNGGKWTNSYGSWKVVSNQCVYSSNTGGWTEAYWNNATYTNTDVYATLATTPANGNSFYLLARYDATVTGKEVYLKVLKDAGADTISIRVFDGVDDYEVASVSQEVSNGDSVRLTVYDYAITGWYKSGAGSWTPVVWGSDDGVMTAGYVGMDTDNSDTQTVVDNFGGGELSITFPSTSVLDDFNRANGALGSNWTARVGTMAINTNQAVVSALDTGLVGSYWNTLLPADQEGFVTIVTLPEATKDCAIGARLDTTNATWYETAFRNGTGLSINKVDLPGAPVTILSSTITFGAGNKLGIRVEGNLIYGFIYTTAWKLIGLVNDTDYTNTGYLHTGGESDTIVWDDFGGTAVASTRRVMLIQ